MNIVLFFAFLSLILAGCSNKQLYQVGQDYQKSECIKEASSGQQHNDCLSADKQTYEEYEKERKKVLNK